MSRERDSLRESLEELQRQRQDVMGQSREIGAKYDSIQEQVPYIHCLVLYTHHTDLPVLRSSGH